MASRAQRSSYRDVPVGYCTYVLARCMNVDDDETFAKTPSRRLREKTKDKTPR